MRRSNATAIAIGSVLGAVAGLDAVSGFLIYYGFWAGIMLVVWIPGSLGMFAVSKKFAVRAQPIVLGSIAAACVFAAVYTLVGIPSDEGSPAESTGVGMWMVFWSAAALLSLFSLVMIKDVAWTRVPKERKDYT
jgi:hypothetical protein